MVAWQDVAHDDVAHAIKEHDRLGPEQFFSKHGFGQSRNYGLIWENTIIRTRQSWARLMSSPRASALPPLTLREGRPAR